MSAPCPRLLPTWWVGTSLCLVFVALVGNPTAAPGGGGKKADPQYESYLKQLKNRFQEWDRNNDDILDKAELAKAFRGPNAKPYDDPQPVKTIIIPAKVAAPAKVPDKYRVTSTSVMLASLPQGGLPVNLALAELMARNRKAVSTTPAIAAEPTILTAPPANVNAYADVQFLQLLNKVKAGQVTKQGFDNWAKDYAGMLNRLVDNERDVKAAQQSAKNAKSKKALQEAQMNLQRQERELLQAQAQLNNIPAAVQKAFHLKR